VKVLLITGGVKSWSVVAALQEVGIEIVGTSVKKSTAEDKQRIKEIMGEEAHMIEDMTPRKMYKMLKEARADIMLSGGRSQFVALKAKMPWPTSTRSAITPMPARRYGGVARDRQGVVHPVEQVASLHGAGRRTESRYEARDWKNKEFHILVLDPVSYLRACRQPSRSKVLHRHRSR
jgi:hypothetical protein